MSQTRTWDYKEKDFTRFLNDKDRQILLPGVYWGFNLAKGAGAREIEITQDVDPRNLSLLLGVLLTTHGVTVKEDADLPSLFVSTADTDDRIDILVCNYSYNASKPPNQASYTIREGTPGTTAFVELLDVSSVPSIRIESFLTTAAMNGWQVTTLVNGPNLDLQVLDPEGAVVETWPSITRAGIVAQINNNSSYLWVTVLTAGSPGEPIAQGPLTLSGGVDPVRPTLALTDTEIGWVYVRKNQAAILADEVRTATKLNTLRDSFNDQYPTTIGPRVLKGMEISPGTTVLRVSLGAGTFLSGEGTLVGVPESIDGFQATAPTGLRWYRAALCVLHRTEIGEDDLGPTLLVVPGPEAVFTLAGDSSPIRGPTDQEILDAAINLDPRFNLPEHIRVVGYATWSNDGSTTRRHGTSSTLRWSEEGLYEVGDGLGKRETGPYSGWPGLLRLLEDLKALEAGYALIARAANVENPTNVFIRDVEIRLTGFFIADATCWVPSHVRIGGKSTVLPLVKYPFRLSGREINGAGDIAWSAAADGDQSNVSPGSTRMVIDIDPDFQIGDDLEKIGLSRGAGSDFLVEWRTEGGPTALVVADRGIVTGPWQFKIVMTSAELATFNPVTDDTGSVVLRKIAPELSGCRVLPKVSLSYGTNGVIEAFCAQGVVIEASEADDWEISDLVFSTLRELLVTRQWTSGLSSTVGQPPRGNFYAEICIDQIYGGGPLLFGKEEEDSTYERITARLLEVTEINPVQLLGTRNNYGVVDTISRSFPVAHLQGSLAFSGVTISGTIALGGSNIVPRTFSAYVPLATPASYSYLTDDGLGNLRDATVDGTGTIRGTINYATGAYSATVPIGPTAAPTFSVMTGASALLRGSSCRVDYVEGNLVVDEDSTLGRVGQVRNISFRPPAAAQVRSLLGTVGNVGARAAPHVEGDRKRHRAGSDSYNGTDGVEIIFSTPMPDASYRVYLASTHAIVLDGRLGEVVVSSKTANSFFVFNSGWDPGDGNDPLGVATFDWLALYPDSDEI